MTYLEINSANKFNKVKFLKEQENIKLDSMSDNQNMIVEQEIYFYSAITNKKSFCDYLVVNDFDEM